MHPLQDFRSLDVNTVKYVTEPAYRRRKYMITIGAKLRRGESLEEFDTQRIKSFYLAKYGKPYEESQLTPAQQDALKGNQEKISKGSKQFKPIAVPVHGRDKVHSKQLAGLSKEWEKKSLIWVCVDEKDGPTFYSHIGKQDHFHHTSFNAGGEVLGAGEWIVEKGKLLRISANSGHYQPTLQYLYTCVMLLAEACNQDTTVFVWSKELKQWVDVPHNDFKNEPELFTSHPRSVATGAKVIQTMDSVYTNSNL